MKKILQFDLARGRVPRPETVFKLTDLLIPHGLTGIQFYLETVVENSVFPACGSGEHPVPQSYLLQIRKFCESRGIEFIPHFQIFSHQENLLRRPEMEKYAESPGSSCFRLDLPELREKIKAYIGEVSAYFSSPYIHCGGDEAFTLGMGRSRSFVEKLGFENAFSGFVNEINGYIRTLGKIMLLYADTPLLYHTLARRLDQDIVMVNWAYCVRHEIYEDENYHYRYHEYGIRGHRFGVTGNCMAEYLFTPFYRLKENTDIWRELGVGAELFTISDWGTYENVNPFVLTLLGALFALHRIEEPEYSQACFIRDAEAMILGQESEAFQEAYRILLNAGGPDYWNSRILYRGVPLPDVLFSDPESKWMCLLCGMIEPKKLDLLEKNVRKAVSLLDCVNSEGVSEPNFLEDLKMLSKRVLAAVLRLKMCFRFANDTGGIWFTPLELAPRIHQFEEYLTLTEADMAFLEYNWRRDNLDSCLERTLRFYRNSMKASQKTLRLPENTLRIFPPELE